MMTAQQMVREMTRQPDAHLLVEWTQEVLATRPTDQAQQACADIDTVTAAYFEALEG